MQKYYIRDFLTKELEKNDGKLTQYYVENDHEAIIEREIWDAAQLEINRIKEFKRNHQIRELGSSSLEPFYGKIFFLQPKLRYAYLMYVNTKYLARHPAG